MTADSRTRRWLRALPVLAGALAALIALTAALRWAQTPPDGPTEPTWSRTPCARCGMLVGEPAFAAQLHTPAGDMRFFDDVGCLLLYAAERPDHEAAAWFHHLREPRWIPAHSAGFVSAGGTPMGYGLGAVEAGEPGAISRAAALAETQRVEQSRAGSAP
jgi:copper chaperone NosL